MFAEWVLGVVAVLVAGGVIASIKHAIDVAVIKNMLRNGDARFTRQEEDIKDIRTVQKRHSERIRNLEVPPSNGRLKPHRGS